MECVPFVCTMALQVRAAAVAPRWPAAMLYFAFRGNVIMFVATARGRALVRWYYMMWWQQAQACSLQAARWRLLQHTPPGKTPPASWQDTTSPLARHHLPLPWQDTPPPYPWQDTTPPWQDTTTTLARHPPPPPPLVVCGLPSIVAVC